MGVKTTIDIQCDVCERIPRPPTDTEKEISRGTFAYRVDDSDQYGWLGLHPEHLTLNGMGHNSIPSDTIILCPNCWPQVLGKVRRKNA